METMTTKPEEKAQQELGDETFMSAADLRNYMTEMQMAKAMKSVDGMDKAGKAREDLIKRMAEPHRPDARALEGNSAAAQDEAARWRRSAERPS